MVAGLCLAIGVLVLAPACERSDSPHLSTPELPDSEVSNFTLTETVDGEIQWRMTAASAETYRGRGVIIAHDVAIDFFDEEGVVYSHLVSREGEIETATNNMIARGNVVVSTTNGTRIETETLHFLNQPRRIVSDDPVTVRRGGNVLTGIGFESDPSLEQFEFRSRVRAQVTSPRGGGSRSVGDEQ